MRGRVAIHKGKVYRETAELRRNKLVKTWWIAPASLSEPLSPINNKTQKGAFRLQNSEAAERAAKTISSPPSQDYGKGEF
jgi:hypothetical protein